MDDDTKYYRADNNGVIADVRGEELTFDGNSASVAAWRAALEAQELLTPGVIEDYPS